MFESSHIAAAIIAVATFAPSAFEVLAGSSYRGPICPTGAKIGSSFWEFRESGVKLKSLGEANPGETRFGSRYWEVRETEGSRNRDSTVLFDESGLLFKQTLIEALGHLLL